MKIEKNLNILKKKLDDVQFHNVLFSLIYPNTCGICGKIEKEYICKKCEIILNNKFQNNINFERYKLLEEKYLDEHIYLFKYDNVIRKLLIEYKFFEKAYLYKTFVKIMLKNERIVEKIKKYDTIIPIPISKKRFYERGYNQSLLIAKEISERLNIEILNDCIIKTKNIVPQSSLSKEERIKNINGVYNINNKYIIDKRNMYKIKNKKILLIDDIFTTGATVNEACKELKKLEYSQISVLTIAKG